jgi:hypothetical protein
MLQDHSCHKKLTTRGDKFLMRGSVLFIRLGIIHLKCPHLRNPWPRNSYWKGRTTPLYSGSGIIDLDRLSFCTMHTCQLDEINYLETRSRCVNTSFIIEGSVWLTSLYLRVQISFFLYRWHIILFYKIKYLNKEVNHAEPSIIKDMLTQRDLVSK